MNRTQAKEICVETAHDLREAIQAQIASKGEVPPEWAKLWRDMANHDAAYHALFGFHFFTELTGRTSRKWEGNKTR